MGPSVRVTSTDALRPSSARSGRGTSNRDSPAASVSSVSGDGPKNPVPNETLPVQAPPRKSADALGLKNVPYSLSRSSRPLALSDSHVATSTSSCTNTPGTVKMLLESRNVDRPIVITFQRRAGDERVTSDRRTQTSVHQMRSRADRARVSHLTKLRQAVREEACVSATHALNPHTRRTFAHGRGILSNLNLQGRRRLRVSGRCPHEHQHDHDYS
jgi:hypothetical protein